MCSSCLPAQLPCKGASGRAARGWLPTSGHCNPLFLHNLFHKILKKKGKTIQKEVKAIQEGGLSIQKETVQEGGRSIQEEA